MTDTSRASHTASDLTGRLAGRADPGRLGAPESITA